MKSVNQMIAFIMAVFALSAFEVWAEQRIIVTDHSPLAVEVSARGMTVLKFPNHVEKVFSSMKGVAVEPAGPNVVISKISAPGDLVVMTEGEVMYTFQLEPVEVSAEAIVVEDRRRVDHQLQDDAIVKKASTFVSQLVELTRVFGDGDIPRGYQRRSEEEGHALVPSWVGLDIEQIQVFDGPAYTVVLLSLRNTSQGEHTIHSWEWNGPHVLGVSMNRDHVLPGETASIMIIREPSQPSSENEAHE